MLRTDHGTVVGNGLPTYADLFWSVKARLDRQSKLCHSMRNIRSLNRQKLVIHLGKAADFECLHHAHEIKHVQPDCGHDGQYAPKL